MPKIQIGRVLMGGLLTGLVLTIGEYLLNDVVLSDVTKQELARLNLPAPGGMFVVRVVGMTFVLGIMIIYLYAAIRPRFGPGVGTAICAGLFAWFFVYLYCAYIYFALGVVSMKAYMIGLVWGLFQYSIAAIAGAWLYREEPS